ncbi:MAG: secretion protein, partial [Bacteroidota bacterium]
MKKIFIIITLVVCANIHSQLSIQNDAFVFVDDEVIFVTDDVNIDDADSRFYLRNEAQLIQGPGTTGNSGLGQLSIYQTGTSNQWSYNYWCSPVGNNSATFGNENFRIELIDDPLLSTPLDVTDSQDALFTGAFDGTASPLTISDRWLWTLI